MSTGFPFVSFVCFVDELSSEKLLMRLTAYQPRDENAHQTQGVLGFTFVFLTCPGGNASARVVSFVDELFSEEHPPGHVPSKGPG
jgi:hypothetical protein